MQYIFSVPDSMENNNVIMSFNIGTQNLKAKDRTFPLKYKVFKVRQHVSGLALWGNFHTPWVEKATD